MKSFVTSLLLSIVLLASSLVPQDPKPKPCQCLPCSGGEIRCPPKSSAYCECTKAGRCIGECFPIQKTARQEAIIVLTYITKENISEDLLDQGQKRFRSLLEKLLNGKEDEGVYRIEYEGRPIRFSFTPTTVELLEEARKSLDRT